MSDAAVNPYRAGTLSAIAWEQGYLMASGAEWRDHIPSGYEDQIGYGQVSCSCGWMSEDGKLGWEEHIDAANRLGEALG